MPRIEPLTDQAEYVSHYFAADFLATRSPGAHMKAIIDDFVATYKLSERKNKPEFAESLDQFAIGGFAWERAVVRGIMEGVMPDLAAAPAETVRRIYSRAFTVALNEAHYERRSGEIIKPGEILCEGIYCTADGLNKRLRCGEEWKCSWASAAASLEDAHPDWLMQMPGYAYAWGLDSWILRVFHVNGMYEYARMGRPCLRFWRLRWSDEELAENWQLILGHRELMREEGRLG